MPPAIDLSGQRFVRLVVVSRSTVDKWGNYTWLCRCDCGAEITIPSGKLRSGSQVSCGCLRTDRLVDKTATLQGMTVRYPKEHNSYRAMLRRCYDSTHKAYPYYGGRGIVVCSAWLTDFSQFFKDMGQRPEGYTLDRIDSNKNYEPDNCRWATWAVQAKNKRAFPFPI